MIGDPDESGPRDFGELIHDYLLEYSRKFLFEVLRGAPPKDGGSYAEVLTGLEITLRWPEWCARYGTETEMVTGEVSDEELKSVYDEVLGYLVFLSLRLCGKRGLPPSVAALITRSVPESPFGAFEPKDIVTRYSRGANAPVLFAQAVCDRLQWPDPARPRLILIAATMAKFTEAVIEDARPGG